MALSYRSRLLVLVLASWPPSAAIDGEQTGARSSDDVKLSAHSCSNTARHGEKI